MDLCGFASLIFLYIDKIWLEGLSDEDLLEAYDQVRGLD